MCQLKLRIPGTEKHIFPDIVLFVNGLPVVLIECKSPKVKDAIPEAIDQMLRYSGQRGQRGRQRTAQGPANSAPVLGKSMFLVWIPFSTIVYFFTPPKTSSWMKFSYFVIHRNTQ